MSDMCSVLYEQGGKGKAWLPMPGEGEVPWRIDQGSHPEDEAQDLA